MSTSVATAQATYLGTNGANGTKVTAQPTYTTVAVSPAIGQPNLVNAAVSPATAVPTYLGTNGSNGTAITAQKVPGTLGTQGPAASGSTPPTYNPGS